MSVIRWYSVVALVWTLLVAVHDMGAQPAGDPIRDLMAGILLQVAVIAWSTGRPR